MHVLRRQTDNVVIFVSFLALAALFLLREDGLGFLLAAAAVVVAVRSLRSGVYVDDDALVVRNLLTTHRVPRHDIEDVAPGLAGRVLKQSAVVVNRRDGNPVPLWCLMPTSSKARRNEDVLVSIAADVNQALR